MDSSPEKGDEGKYKIMIKVYKNGDTGELSSTIIWLLEVKKVVAFDDLTEEEQLAINPLLAL